MRGVRRWNRLSRKVVNAPSLEVLRVRLDGILMQPDLAKGVPDYGSGVGVK